MENASLFTLGIGSLLPLIAFHHPRMFEGSYSLFMVIGCVRLNSCFVAQKLGNHGTNAPNAELLMEQSSLNKFWVRCIGITIKKVEMQDCPKDWDRKKFLEIKVAGPKYSLVILFDSHAKSPC